MCVEEDSDIAVCLNTLPSIYSGSSLMMCCRSFQCYIPKCFFFSPCAPFLFVFINGVMKKFLILHTCMS